MLTKKTTKVLKSFTAILLSYVFLSTVFAIGCCDQMGGTSYCDSSAGRLVCRNGFYSTCYCTRHAVMNLQLLKGCCLWRGGVTSTINMTGLVSCNDGSISEECSIGHPTERVASF
ncbi:MAG: neurogenic locus notch [Legionella sp.]|nr:neurogenic locus notch [Legionella sp.]